VAFSLNKFVHPEKNQGRHQYRAERAYPNSFATIRRAQVVRRQRSTIGNSPRAFSPSDRLGLLTIPHAAPLAVLLSPPEGSWTPRYSLWICVLSKSFASRNWRKLASFKRHAPPHPLRAAGVTISHEFQPVMEVAATTSTTSSSATRRSACMSATSPEKPPCGALRGARRRTLRGIHKRMEPERVSLSLERTPAPPRHSRATLCYPSTHCSIRHARMRIVSAGMPGPLCF